MDKQQRELIQTYIRKRKFKIISDINNLGNYDIPIYLPSILNFYELNYMINNDLLQDAELKKIIQIMDNYYIDYFLSKFPNIKFINKINLNNLKDWNIRRILSDQPQLINYFKPYLNKFDDINIEILLKNQPQLKKYFEKN
jgi:hypothetical protein